MAEVFPVIPEDDFLQNPHIVREVERLNSAGMSRIMEGVDIRPEYGVPLGIVRPLKDQHRPLNDYDMFAIRSLGFSGGLHHEPIFAGTALIAELYQAPVIILPNNSRSWTSIHDVRITDNWHKKADHKKDLASIDLFADNAKYGKRSLVGLQQAEGLPGQVRLLGDSMGVPVGASLADRLRCGFDVLSLGGIAMPNIMPRKVIRGIIRDFYHAADLPGGMMKQMLEGAAPYLIPAGLEVGDPIPVHSRLEELKAQLNYVYFDIFGKSLHHFRRNESFTRALSRPTGVTMIEKLLPRLPVTLGFFEHDPIAPLAVAEAHFSRLIGNPQFRTAAYADRDHAGCVNPYIAGDIALRSAGMIEAA